MSLATASWSDALRLIRKRGSLEAVADYQRRRLMALIQHAAREVPYYRMLFQTCDFYASEFRGMNDLQRIPQHSKQDLRAIDESQRIARDIDSTALVTHLTAGSTGQPVVIRRLMNEELLLGLLRNMAEVRIGVRMRDITGCLVEQSLRTSRTLPGRAAQAIGLFRRFPISVRERREETAAAMARLAPDVARGYPSALRNTAIALEALGESFSPPRLVLTGGEMLLPETRRQIERGFRAPLFECYASHEFNLLAAECPHGTGLLHTCDEGALVEVVNNGQAVQVGEQGEVVATALHSYSMPFIRFRTGDLAVRGPSPCPCGFVSGTLHSIVGRRVDYFLLPGDRWLHPASITGPMLADEITWVEQHQLVQEQENRILMKIKVLRPPPPQALDRIISYARDVLGDDVHFRIKLVNRLTSASGKKFKQFISLSTPREEVKPVIVTRLEEG